MKKFFVLGALISCMLAFSGCESHKELTIEQFKEAMGDTYCTDKAIADKYGSYTIETQISNASEYSIKSIQTDGTNYVLTSDDGMVRVYYGQEWYRKKFFEGEAEFAKFVEFDTDYNTVYLANFLDWGHFDFREIDDATIEKTKDGYTYFHQDGDEEFSYAFTVNLNKDLSIKDLTLDFDANGDKRSRHDVYTYSKSSLKLVEDLKKQLAASNGENRHATYHLVHNGEVIKTYEADVPKGFGCISVFPLEYVNNDAESYKFYLDKELAKAAKESNYSDDTELYVAVREEYSLNGR